MRVPLNSKQRRRIKRYLGYWQADPFQCDNVGVRKAHYYQSLETDDLIAVYQYDNSQAGNSQLKDMTVKYRDFDKSFSPLADNQSWNAFRVWRSTEDNVPMGFKIVGTKTGRLTYGENIQMIPLDKIFAKSPTIL